MVYARAWSAYHLCTGRIQIMQELGLSKDEISRLSAGKVIKDAISTN